MMEVVTFFTVHNKDIIFKIYYNGGNKISWLTNKDRIFNIYILPKSKGFTMI